MEKVLPVPIEEPITLNYAVTCAAFKLEPDPKIYLVEYQASQTEVQKRLPAGRFQAEDLLKSLGFILETKGRDTNLEYLYMDITTMNDKYLRQSSNVEELSLMNELFNKFTNDLLQRTQTAYKKLSDVEFHTLIRETHLNTARRELKEEIGATSVGKLFFSSLRSSGPHYKIGFTSTEVEAPVAYTGSPDPKIVRSYEKVIDEHTMRSLFNGHSNNFQEGIKCLIEKKAGLDKLKKYLPASR